MLAAFGAARLPVEESLGFFFCGTGRIKPCWPVGPQQREGWEIYVHTPPDLLEDCFMGFHTGRPTPPGIVLADHCFEFKSYSGGSDSRKKKWKNFLKGRNQFVVDFILFIIIFYFEIIFEYSLFKLTIDNMKSISLATF